jgi:hypothetical protein
MGPINSWLQEVPSEMLSFSFVQALRCFWERLKDLTIGIKRELCEYIQQFLLGL